MPPIATLPGSSVYPSCQIEEVAEHFVLRLSYGQGQ